MVNTPVDGALRVSVVTTMLPVMPVSPDTETLIPVVAAFAKALPPDTNAEVDSWAVTLGAYGLAAKDCADTSNTSTSAKARVSLSTPLRHPFDPDQNILCHRTISG